MKRRVLAMMLCVLVVMSFAVSARYNLVTRFLPAFTISGNTASWSLLVQTADSSASIDATLKLCTASGTVLKTWEKSATGTLSFSSTYTVTSPGTYYLKVDVDVDGAAGNDYIKDELSAVKK